MKRLILILSIITGTNIVYGQSGQMQIMKACTDEIVGQTYVNRKDGETLTFYKNRDVAINGKIDKRYKYEIADCMVDLSFNDKYISHLKISSYWFDDEESGTPFVKDQRGIIYFKKQIDLDHK